MDVQNPSQNHVRLEKRLIQERHSREKHFCGCNWSISGESGWESVLDWRSRQLQSLFLEFPHKNQVATAKEYEIVLQKYDVT